MFLKEISAGSVVRPIKPGTYFFYNRSERQALTVQLDGSVTLTVPPSSYLRIVLPPVLLARIDGDNTVTHLLTDFEMQVVGEPLLDRTASIAHANPSAGGDAAVITAPGAGLALQVKWLMVWNRGAADVTVYWHYGADATRSFPALLAAKTGYIANLIGCNFKDATGNRALNLNLSAAVQVDSMVLYKVVAV